MAGDLGALVGRDAETLSVPGLCCVTITECDFNNEVVYREALISCDGSMPHAGLPSRTPNVGVSDGTFPVPGGCTESYIAGNRCGFLSTSVQRSVVVEYQVTAFGEYRGDRGS